MMRERLSTYVKQDEIENFLKSRSTNKIASINVPAWNRVDSTKKNIAFL